MFHLDIDDLIEHMHRPNPLHVAHLKRCPECRKEEEDWTPSEIPGKGDLDPSISDSSESAIRT